jgi:hypothetical protein
LIIWKVQVVPQYQLNIYNTNNYPDGYCLLSYAIDDTIGHDDSIGIRRHQTTSYCLRTLEENHFIVDLNFLNTINPSFTYAKLKDKNITRQMLFSCVALIDLAVQ